MNSSRRGRTLALVLLVALVGTAVACGDDAQPAEVGAGSGGDGGLDPDEVVVSIELVGAFTTPEWTFQNLPTAVVYGDGTRLAVGPQTMIYPGAAVPPVLHDELTADDVEDIVAAARDAGLDAEDVDYGQPPVADAGDTLVTVNIDGRTYVHRATALGLAEGGLGASDQLSDEQLAAREALAGFVSHVTGLAGSAEPEAYAADRYRLWVRPADEVDAGMEDDDLGPRRTEWTVDAVSLEASDCTPVEGEAATAVHALMAEADQLTRFDAGGTTWSVVARPVLPHEPTCPEA